MNETAADSGAAVGPAPGSRVVKIAFIAAVTAYALWVGLHGLFNGRELQRRLMCASRLERLAAAMRDYESEIPAETVSIADWLVARGAVEASAAVCPASRRPPPHYVLLRRGSWVAFDGRAAVGYEPPGNHREGGCAVFAEGDAAYLSPGDYRRFMDRVEAVNR